MIVRVRDSGAILPTASEEGDSYVYSYRCTITVKVRKDLCDILETIPHDAALPDDEEPCETPESHRDITTPSAAPPRSPSP